MTNKRYTEVKLASGVTYTLEAYEANVFEGTLALRTRDDFPDGTFDYIIAAKEWVSVRIFEEVADE